MNPLRLPDEIAGLGEIAGDYDSLICDVWGVVHDGRKPFPQTIEALRAFRKDRGPVVLLTNAPRVARDVEKQFDRIGVPHDCYDGLVTSGEGAREELRQRAQRESRLKIYNLGPERDRAVHEGLKIELAGTKDAELILCTGLFNDETETPEDYRKLLGKFADDKLEMLCANPDRVVRRGDRLVYCAGALAQLYEEMDGSVKYFGKPYAPVFEIALQRARERGRGRKPLIVGDGIETDITGANTMGWDALFVAGGVHGVELGSLPGDEGAKRLALLFEEHAVTARYSIPNLRW